MKTSINKFKAAFILSLLGWAWVVVMTAALMLFPGFFRALIHVFHSALSGSLIGWRILGLVRIAISSPFIYFGAYDGSPASHLLQARMWLGHHEG